MSKKLLLSTVLTGTMLASTGAIAADYEIKYIGSNKFTLNDTEYTGIDAVSTYIKTSGNFDLETDDFIMPAESQRSFLDALKEDGSNERNSFSRAIAEIGRLDLGQVQAGVNEAMTLLSFAESDLGIDILEYIDFENPREVDFEDVQEAYKYFQALQDASVSVQTADQEFII